jgi:hypothetical protein
VPTFFTVTAAPATTSLLGLLTTPPIEPVVVDWAKAALKANANKATTDKRVNKNFTVFDIYRGTPSTDELTVTRTLKMECES